MRQCRDPEVFNVSCMHAYYIELDILQNSLIQLSLLIDVGIFKLSLAMSMFIITLLTCTCMSISATSTSSTLYQFGLDVGDTLLTRKSRRATSGSIPIPGKSYFFREPFSSFIVCMTISLSSLCKES